MTQPHRLGAFVLAACLVLLSLPHLAPRKKKAPTPQSSFVTPEANKSTLEDFPGSPAAGKAISAQ